MGERNIELLVLRTLFSPYKPGHRAYKEKLGDFRPTANSVEGRLREAFMAKGEPEAKTIIYFAKIGDLLKVGCSEDLDTRFGFLRKNGEVTLLGTKRGGFVTEAAVHMALAPQRAKGREWYFLTDEIMTAICEVCHD